ncbi:MAG: hypothetical protein HOW73_33175 [Polyangiaceae bacterium]|nr:hypothetical protein [Polyangiaceae bacterium]
MRLASTLLFALAISTTPLAPAYAGDEPSPEARQAFDKGKSLFEARDYEHALPELQRAAELSSSPNAHLYVGRCLKELGRRAEAYEELRIAMKDAARLAASDKKYEKTRDAAAAQVAILEGEVGKVVVVVNGDRAGASVILSSPNATDRTLAPADIGIPRAVEPGAVRARVEADGKLLVEKRAESKAGATVTLVLDVTADGSADKGDVTDPKEASPKPSKPVGAKTGGGIRIAGFVVGGVGIAGLATFGAMAGLALDRKNTLDEACGGTHCPPGEYDDVIDEGRTFQLAANVSLGVGAGLLAGSIFMIAFGGPKDADAEAEPQVAISVDGTGVSATVSF